MYRNIVEYSRVLTQKVIIFREHFVRERGKISNRHPVKFVFVSFHSINEELNFSIDKKKKIILNKNIQIFSQIKIPLKWLHNKS